MLLFIQTAFRSKIIEYNPYKIRKTHAPYVMCTSKEVIQYVSIEQYQCNRLAMLEKFPIVEIKHAN